MLAIANAITLSHVLGTGCDPGLLPILLRYRPMMDDDPLAILFVLQPGDRTEDLATLRGQTFEHWEFITFEAGWYEAVFVLDDYGHGHVVLIPDSDECDPELLTICRKHAVPNG